MSDYMRKTLLCFSFLLVNFYAIAMDPPETEYSRVMAILNDHGREAASNYLRGTEDPVGKRCLEILKNPKKQEFVASVCSSTCESYAKRACQFFELSLEIEKTVLSLVESSSVLLRAFGDQYGRVLNQDITRLENVQHSLRKSKPLKNIKQDAIVKCYDKFLLDGGFCKIDPYNDFDEGGNIWYLSRVICDILNNLEEALSAYCSKVYFPIPVIQRSPAKFIPQNFRNVERYYLTATPFKHIVADRKMINHSVMELLNEIEQEDIQIIYVEDLKKLHEAVKSVEAFVEKYSSSLARQNIAILNDLRGDTRPCKVVHTGISPLKKCEQGSRGDGELEASSGSRSSLEDKQENKLCSSLSSSDYGSTLLELFAGTEKKKNLDPRAGISDPILSDPPKRDLANEAGNQVQSPAAPRVPSSLERMDKTIENWGSGNEGGSERSLRKSMKRVFSRACKNMPRK